MELTVNTHLKICGLRETTNITALLSAVQPYPDYMGFIFYERSPRYVYQAEHKLTPDFMHSLRQQLCTVAVFVNADIPTIVNIVQQYNFGAVQLHGAETPEFVRSLQAALAQKHDRQHSVGIIKAFGIADKHDMERVQDYTGSIDFVLFDTKSAAHGGTGTRFDWSMLGAYTHDIPFFLSGGISPDDAEEIKQLRHPKLWAVDINSRFEAAPGVKAVQKIQNFHHELQ